MFLSGISLLSSYREYLSHTQRSQAIAVSSSTIPLTARYQKPSTAINNSEYNRTSSISSSLESASNCEIDSARRLPFVSFISASKPRMYPRLVSMCKVILIPSTSRLPRSRYRVKMQWSGLVSLLLDNGGLPSLLCLCHDPTKRQNVQCDAG